MPYDIFGYVETAPVMPGPWRAAFELSQMSENADDYSREIFGLGKYTRIGEGRFANRGLPLDACQEVQDYVVAEAEFEKEEGTFSGDMDHTFATLDELKGIPVPSDSWWQTVFLKIDELQRQSGASDAEIRILVWGNW